MAKRFDIKSILVIGSGPIVVGQACEFDYSGTQACSALKDEGYRVILVNSNPATRMTDREVADVTYLEPITEEFLTEIIKIERPCALLPTMGGQTALNCAMNLEHSGVLKKYGVELIGANAVVIERAENRETFRKIVSEIGLKCPESLVVKDESQINLIIEKLGLPVIVRSSFTLGGVGSGVAENKEQLIVMIKEGLSASPINEVQVDKSILGWKEFELEVVRDAKDNCIVVCAIENFDPVGVHTGDSITVAPVLTLLDSEYQKMRDASIAILRKIGVDTGGSNVQFAINPDNHEEILVIEMNPRVSRSSALASKATGFPIAKVAAKLSVGYTLDEISNECAAGIPASFEPTLDYVILKFPRFNFDKFKGASDLLGTSMKSVGEVMSFGRNFTEAFQKGLCSLEIGHAGCDEVFFDESEVRAVLKSLNHNRIYAVADALRLGISVDEIARMTKYDKYYLFKIREIVEIEKEIRLKGLPACALEMSALKKMGFSDERLSELSDIPTEEVEKLRFSMNVEPVYKRVDTCAAEFRTNTAYMYETYEQNMFSNGECEAAVSDKKKVIIIGSGPNRIGQGIEFDYACVHAVYAVKKCGCEAIVINCNPETVSTDYNISDRLYFVPLVWENVHAILRKESEKGELLGVILQFGGQTPLKLAAKINQHGFNILGTSFESINLAEDRDSFNSLMNSLQVPQPAGVMCFSEENALKLLETLNFPIIARPSYVLGGQSMCILKDQEEFLVYLNKNKDVFKFGSLLIDEFLSEAIEIDVDALGDGLDVKTVGLMQHVEEAGIHSGDSACFMPSSLDKETIDLISSYTEKIGKALNVRGLMNIQYAVKQGKVFVLEVNPRASRSVPFVAKATGVQVAEIATKLMLGGLLSDFDIDTDISYVAVKESVFSFSRFIGADLLLGPEMKSTGEVMAIDSCFELAFLKAQIAAGYKIKDEGTVFLSVNDRQKNELLISIAKDLRLQGFNLIATAGTYEYLSEQGIDISKINKVREGGRHIIEEMHDGNISLVINISGGEKSISDSIGIRREAICSDIPYSTTMQGASCIVKAIRVMKKLKFTVKSIQSYYNSR